MLARFDDLTRLSFSRLMFYNEPFSRLLDEYRFAIVISLCFRLADKA